MTQTIKHLILTSALLAVHLGPFVHASATTFEGFGTVYDVGSPSSGNCNFMAWPDAAVTKYAALNADQWDDTMNCGRCAEVWCTDDSCSGRSSEVVYILDQCPGCSHGDLDLSPAVFKSVTGQSPSKLSIAWKFVDCPVSNNVQYCLKSGSSNFWIAVQPANFACGVESLTINGQKTSMVDSAYYFLIDGSGDKVVSLDSVSIALTGLNGEVLEETLSLAADACTEGNSQFSYNDNVMNTGSASFTSRTSSVAPTKPPRSTKNSSTTKKSNALRSSNTPPPDDETLISSVETRASSALKTVILEGTSAEVSTNSPCSTIPQTLNANMQGSGAVNSKRLMNGMIAVGCGCALAAIVLALYVCRRRNQIEDHKYSEELLTSGDHISPRAAGVSSSTFNVVRSPTVDSSAAKAVARSV